MPKITIDLDDNIHHILKELAKKEKRSLTNYIIVTLDRYISKLNKSVNSEKNYVFPENSEEKTINTIKKEEDLYTKWRRE